MFAAVQQKSGETARGETARTVRAESGERQACVLLTPALQYTRYRSTIRSRALTFHCHTARHDDNDNALRPARERLLNGTRGTESERSEFGEACSFLPEIKAPAHNLTFLSKYFPCRSVPPWFDDPASHAALTFASSRNAWPTYTRGLPCAIEGVVVFVATILV